MNRRTPIGGLIDRQQAIRFTFDGRPMTGFAGDTLASALIANGVGLVGRSFKYHRPRGIMTAGVEEPNALVGVGTSGRYEPNTRATDVFLYDGLTAVSQNRWPTLAFDLGALAGLFARFIPAGFYYKAFLGPPRLWLVYEHFIRMAAGLGKPPRQADVDAYEQRAAFCDVLVVGSGPAGLAAALSASLTGARVMLVEQDSQLGGGLLRDGGVIDGQLAGDWIPATHRTLLERGARILTRTTAAGYWDHDLLTLVERLTEPGQAPGPTGLAQRLWRVRAKRVVLATGAIERPLLFSGNDRPGVMLAQAARTYANRFGALPGKRVVIATRHDDAYHTAFALAEAGAQIVAILDSRAASSGNDALIAAARERFEVHFAAAVVRTRGNARGLTSVQAITGETMVSLKADLLAVSGGFSPVVHLHMQAGGTLDWHESSGAFVPDIARQRQQTAGVAAGADGLMAGLMSGRAVGRDAALSLGFDAVEGRAPTCEGHLGSGHGGAAPAPDARIDLKTAFVDFQNDVTAADLDLAWREGYRSVEHLKRYTTLGMATDQGKTSNIIGLTRLAAAEQRPVPEVGVTTFRPPYTPITLGALGGEAVGAEVAPVRRLPLYDAHARHKPLWQPVGYWMRPRAYPKGGETLNDAALREARTVRTTVGITDVSTLAKFEVSGPDAARFLEQVCATTVDKLAVGRGRYTFMLREDGMVADDGTVWRLESARYLLTSSSGGADRMAAHLSYVRRVLSPALKVSVVNVQEHWAGIAVAGPVAKTLIAELTGAEPPRHMSAERARIAGVDLLVLAASYSGERAFEVYAPSPAIGPVWTALEIGVQAHGGCLYGLEALEILRIEKGHVEVGGEIDGRMTPYDIGLGKMVRPGGGFIGAQALTRPALKSAARLHLVGLEAISGTIPEGAMLMADAGGPPQGHVTGASVRVLEGGSIALGLLQGGAARMGEQLTASSPTRGQNARVRVIDPVFHDPAGERYRD